MKIIMATTNKNKVREISEMLQGTDISIVSLAECGIDIDIEENGETFAENALIKARAISEITKEIVLADDSGLVIDALNGEPGVHSSRFMGEDTSYEIKNNAILDMLKDVPEEKRGARFVCSMALVYPDGTEKTVDGVFEGRIGYEIAGTNGFGYDPIFYVPEKSMTSAELSPEEKNEMSHRGKALKMIVEELKN